MSQLGERLREARESQGISLSQAAVETRILQRYLVALEDGDYQHLPGDVAASFATTRCISVSQPMN